MQKYNFEGADWLIVWVGEPQVISDGVVDSLITTCRSALPELPQRNLSAQRFERFLRKQKKAFIPAMSLLRKLVSPEEAVARLWVAVTQTGINETPDPLVLGRVNAEGNVTLYTSHNAPTITKLERELARRR